MKVTISTNDGSGIGLISVKVYHEYVVDSSEEAMKIVRFLVLRLENGWEEDGW